ncbi:MAG: hypothetical protein IJ081_07545 [Prevotella sp.]|nr:hypothetical protein [Prevotella sp.]
MITKSIKTILLAGLVCCGSVATLTSCNDIVTYDDDAYIAPENKPNTAPPLIEGIYEVRDVIYDNPLTQVNPGQRVRIKGSNLNHVQHISFNGIEIPVDQVAASADYCVVKVAETFSVGQQKGLEYTTDIGTTTFAVKVKPSPLEIEGLKNEFCQAGEKVSVIGRWFQSYNFGTQVTSITIDGTTLTPTDITNDGMQITIPEGTSEGSVITISWTDGDGATQTANLYYRPTSMMLFGQSLTGNDSWQLKSDADLPSGAAALGYPHIHLAAEMPQWQWNELKIEQVINGLDTLSNRANYQFVFEVLTPKGQPLPSSADGFTDGFMFGMNQPSGSNGCEWEIDGSFDSQGQWQTIRLPLTEVMPFPAYSVASVHNVITKIIFQTAVAGNYDVRLANFRIQRIPMTAMLTDVKEQTTEPETPREPVTTLSEEEHVVANWAGYGIEASHFAQCEAGDILTIYVKDVQSGAQVVLQDMGSWSAFNDADSNKNIATDATSYSYTLTAEDAYKLMMNGLWITGGNYTACKVTLTAVGNE